MTDIDPKQAAQALSDIDEMVRRVRQSRTYDIASRIMIWWGVLVFAGNIATYLWPRHGGSIWIAIDVAGMVGSFGISAIGYPKNHVQGFDLRILVAFLLFFAFGYFCTGVLGHFGPRELGTFWPTYFMLMYCLAGLWFGYAFVAIGLSVTVLTLIGYFFVTGFTFLLWMAMANGGGLILGGLWMRRS